MLKKICVLIITGTLETSLHPVPPVADSAPEWNIFRLAEKAASKSNGILNIHVISPCEAKQTKSLQKYPVITKRYYHHVVFNQQSLFLYRNLLRHILPLRLLVRRFAKLPDLMSWWYLRRAVVILGKIKPDVVIINDRPQIIAYLRTRFPKVRLLLMLRGRIGESKRFLCLLDGIILNSQGIRKYIAQFINQDLPPIWQMPNTLGEEFLIPEVAEDRFTLPKKIILYAGRLIEEKGTRELLLAFRQVYKQMPNIKLIICGARGNYKLDKKMTPYEIGLRTLALEYPIDTVEFLGYIPNNQMAKYYVQATVAVFPSLPYLQESFGMVALEAMRCGTPVVASCQPGFEELVLPGKTGLLVDDPRQVETLAGAILEILQNPCLAQRMGQAGYQRSLDYTPEKGLQSLETILQNYLV